MVLYNHAPVITSLEEGRLVYADEQKQEFIEILGGFAEVDENIVTVCAEV
jgi:F-type H+-transporting ATPase subunit epsilon